MPPDGTDGETSLLVRARLDLQGLTLGRPLGVVLQRVAELATTVVPGADQASISVVRAGRASTAAFTGAVAASLDERQYQAGFGPCLEAARTATTVLLDLRAEEGPAGNESPYAAYAREARRAGAHSHLSVPLHLTPEGQGPDGTDGTDGTERAQSTGDNGGRVLPTVALNLYGLAEVRLDETSAARAEAFARLCRTTLANAVTVTDAQERLTRVERALASSEVIEQAKGVLVARTGQGPEAAFAELVQRSQRENRKLREVAAEVVSRATRPGAAGPAAGPDPRAAQG